MAVNYQGYDPDEITQGGVLLDPNGLFYEKIRGKTRSDGVYEFDQPVLCRFSTLFDAGPGGFYKIPDYLMPHPAFPWALAVDTDWEQLNGDWARLVTTYRGVLNGGVPVQQSKSTSQVQNIRLHPNWANILAAAAGEAGSETAAQCFDIDDNGNQRFLCFSEAAGDYAGIDSYEAGGLTHSYSYNSTGMSDRWDVLKQQDSPKGDPPDAPDESIWILDDIQQEVTGNCFAITETWKTISGNTGPLNTIYGGS